MFTFIVSRESWYFTCNALFWLITFQQMLMTSATRYARKRKTPTRCTANFQCCEPHFVHCWLPNRLKSLLQHENTFSFNHNFTSFFPFAVIWWSEGRTADRSCISCFLLGSLLTNWLTSCTIDANGINLNLIRIEISNRLTAGRFLRIGQRVPL